MNSYRTALRQAYKDLVEIEERRTRLLRLIEELETQANKSQFQLTPPPAGYVAKGTTEEIKTVLRLTPVHLTAVQIRDSILARGIRPRNPKNLLISVHTILKRIEQELDIDRRQGKPRYMIISKR